MTGPPFPGRPDGPAQVGTVAGVGSPRMCFTIDPRRHDPEARLRERVRLETEAILASRAAWQRVLPAALGAGIGVVITLVGQRAPIGGLVALLLCVVAMRSTRSTLVGRLADLAAASPESWGLTQVVVDATGVQQVGPGMEERRSWGWFSAVDRTDTDLVLRYADGAVLLLPFDGITSGQSADEATALVAGLLDAAQRSGPAPVSP